MRWSSVNKASGRGWPARRARRRRRIPAGSRPHSSMVERHAAARAASPVPSLANVADREARPCHKRVAASRRDQMGHDRRRRLGIVDRDEVEDRIVRNTVGDDDRRHGARRQAAREPAVAGDDDEARRTPGPDGAQPFRLLGGIVGRADHEQIEPVAPRRAFQRRHEGPEHRIRQVGHDDAGQSPLAGSQARRVVVCRVAELLGDRADAAEQVGRHARLAVQGVRHGRGRDAGRFGHHPDRNHFDRPRTRAPPLISLQS